jgi:hypothetical protein
MPHQGHQQEVNMRKRLIFLSLGTAMALLVVAAAIVLAPGDHPTPSPAAIAIENSEQARTIEAMRPPNLVAINKVFGTNEITAALVELERRTMDAIKRYLELSTVDRLQFDFPAMMIWTPRVSKVAKGQQAAGDGSGPEGRALGHQEHRPAGGGVRTRAGCGRLGRGPCRPACVSEWMLQDLWFKLSLGSQLAIRKLISSRACTASVS